MQIQVYQVWGASLRSSQVMRMLFSLDGTHVAPCQGLVQIRHSPSQWKLREDPLTSWVGFWGRFLFLMKDKRILKEKVILPPSLPSCFVQCYVWRWGPELREPSCDQDEHTRIKAHPLRMGRREHLWAIKTPGLLLLDFLVKWNINSLWFSTLLGCLVFIAEYTRVVGKNSNASHSNFVM